MSVILKALPYFHWRDAEKPPLPAGWRYHERKDHWIIAESPDGKFWFAGGHQLCRMKFASNWDVLKSQLRALVNKWVTPYGEGDIYADTRETYTL